MESEKQLTINGVKPISPEQEELIHRLVYFQNEYEHPPEEDVKRIMVRWKFLILQYLEFVIKTFHIKLLKAVDTDVS